MRWERCFLGSNRHYKMDVMDMMKELKLNKEKRPLQLGLIPNTRSSKLHKEILQVVTRRKKGYK